ncbi:MAG TPA: hypothetical protein VJ813_18890 [Vicinamibacterales bacterium]|nr:hypothetical protein [Vicinamibacterales bacterium]
MTVPRVHTARAFTAVAVIVAAAGALLVYGGQIDTGLYYDDYHFLRPVHELELRRVWFGSWDPTGIESPFFRPITAWLFALRFWAFGLNTLALHAVSIAGHVLCAACVGWLLRREGAPTGVSLMGAWLYAVHPLFPYAQVSWLTNQMHLAESLVVILALLTWQSVRDRPARWSVALLPLAVTAFLIKEDAVMLLPILLALTMQRGWLVDSTQWKRVVMMLPVVTLALATLIGFRHQRLGQLGGYGVPGLEQAQAQFWKGLDAALLLWPTRTPWQAVAGLIAISALAVALARGNWKGNKVVALIWCAAIVILSTRLPALFLGIAYPLIAWQGIAGGVVIAATLTGAGVAATRQLHQPVLIMMTGLVITLGFNLPFALVSKREQYHLVALGAVLLLAGSVDALRTAAGRVSRYVLPVAVLASLPLALLARTQAAAFQPCAPGVLSTDGEASGWWALPGEIRAWLPQKKQRCEAGLSPSSIAELPVVSWGLYDEERGADGEPYRWTSDRVVLLLRPDARSVAFAFRSPDASRSAPVRIRVRGGSRTAELTLDSIDWQYMTVRLSGGALTTLRSAHRVDVSITPWFVPAVRDPRNADLRRLGVHFRMVEN